jgi:ribonuclease P protein component
MTETRVTGFARRQRLLAAAQFRGILRRGVRIERPLFLLVGMHNGRDHHRLGLTAGRRLGTAVERNRAKRLLRESFRRTACEGPEGYDLVVVPKREIVGRTQTEVDLEYRDSLRRLQRRTAAGRGGARAPAAG